jgi:DNA-binding IclR family transcriptional regulator
MSDKSKLEILRLLGEDTTTGKIQRFSFNTLSKNLQLPKDKLEILLMELNKDRFVAQYTKKGVDSFTVEVKQKGLDAIQDELLS